jgi:hypothetical protein
VDGFPTVKAVVDGKIKEEYDADYKEASLQAFVDKTTKQ